VSVAGTKVLFTGYAPVHFVCFQPLFERLNKMPGVEAVVSGGLRSKNEDGEVLHDADALYAPFRLSRESVLTVEQIREMDFDVLFCANTKRIEPRSFGQSIEIFHGMSFRNKAVREENTGNDRYFVLGPYMLRRFREFGFFAADDPRAVEVGFPKTDRLLDGSLDRDLILRHYGFSGERPVILYAPTGAKRNSLETMGEDLIRLLSASGEYDLLVKPHDHPKHKLNWFERLGPLEHEHLRLVREPDVVPTLFVADLLISDASSVVNEYALLDRPVVFLDVPELLAAAGGEGSALDLETWGRRGGEVATNPVAALQAVADGLADPGRHSDVRAGIVEDLFFNPGAATDAAIDFLCEELSLS
jgi:CDP-glycerol glycerophosphotransferase (TagB/SpsB family)